ncbi:MAG TPA: hypothetical protein VMR18_00940 [Candidatus Saccharimonadales bacterium]|nr:hypothetical protein [Candidatus Saccharimonadales bacterium]
MPPRRSAASPGTPSRSKALPSAKRSIYFYRANAGFKPSGKPVAVDLRSTLTKVGGLPCAEGGRYLEQDDGNILCSWVDSADDQRFRLATIRRADLPRVEQGGNLTDLHLSADQGLYEPIHIQVFDNNIFGVEFNFYGPRPSRLCWYLRRVTGDEKLQFTLDSLLRQDVIAQLNRIEEVRLLDLAIRPSYASIVRLANRDLGAAFEAAARVANPEVVRLILSPEAHGRSFLRRTIRTAARTLAARNDITENAQTFSVKGLDVETQTIEVVDVLRDQLVASKSIVRLDRRSRAINDDAAYAAIQEAYTTMESELHEAAAVQVGSASVGRH